MTALITPQEVIRYSDIDLNTPVCNFRQIVQIESYIFGTKFNSDLYKDLLANLVDFSDVQTWKVTDVINEDDLKQYNGQYYVALESSTGVLPTNKDKWSPAKKFQSDCFNDLWCEVLANYLAMVIVENRLPKIWIKVKSDGIIKQKGELFDSVNSKDYQSFHGSVMRDCEICYYNLMEYIKNTSCLSLYSYGSCETKQNIDSRGEYSIG